MDQGRLTRWVSALMLALCMALSGQALAQSNSMGPANPSVVLVSQPSNSEVPPSNADASNLISNISQAADDFVVPDAKFWHITTVSALGRDVGSTGSGVITLAVQFYGDSGSGLPGVLLSSKAYPSDSSTHLSDGTLRVLLNPTFTLGPGHYWFSVQPQVSSCPPGGLCQRWQWNESPGQQYAESAWKGNSVSSCRTWQPRVTVCGVPTTSAGKDLAFELDGFTTPVVSRDLLPLIRR